MLFRDLFLIVILFIMVIYRIRVIYDFECLYFKNECDKEMSFIVVF